MQFCFSFIFSFLLNIPASHSLTCSDIVLNREILVENYSVYYIFFWCPNYFHVFWCPNYFHVFSHALEDKNSFFYPDYIFKETSVFPEEFQLNFPLSSPEKKNASAAETSNIID